MAWIWAHAILQAVRDFCRNLRLTLDSNMATISNGAELNRGPELHVQPRDEKAAKLHVILPWEKI